MPGVLPVDSPLGQRSNALWMGTHVQSGSAHAPIVATGKHNEFGKLSERSKFKAPETECVVGLTLSLPCSPLAGLVGFQPLPLILLGMLGLIVFLYIAIAEFAKRVFYRFV